mmetsp:Transcript_6952/g.15247  ORF Transcript_6952/g.15247 Transcript_6952/m.15247 type:complete len:228 (-) Transcript_6952:1292-1975(-)
MTVGGSCCGSPSRTPRRARKNGSHALGCVACDASSRNARSKSGSCEMAASAAPVAVHSTTSAEASASNSPLATRLASTVRMCRLRKERICALRVAPILSLAPTSAKSRESSALASSLSSTALRAATRSGVSPRARTSIRSGLPKRTIRRFESAATSRSTSRSTAMLAGAQSSSRSPRATHCRTDSTRTAVLPVPGGPCTTAKDSFTDVAESTARSCTGLRVSSNTRD